MSVRFKGLYALLIISLLTIPFALSIEADTVKNPVVKVKTRVDDTSINQRQDFEKLLAEGKRLYLEEMDNDAALEMFKEAEAAASTREQKAEVFFYFSLIYYAQSRDIGNQEFDRAVRRLIELDYYRELDKLLCPPKYLELFGQIKREYGVVHVRSSPSGAEVYVDNSKEIFGFTPVDIGHKGGNIALKLKREKAEKSDTLQVTAGEEMSSPVYKLKKRSSLLFIVGGAALAGGVSAFLFLGKEKAEPTGSIRVNSTPSGAEVFLDDSSTGQITNCTLANVMVGPHTVEVAREGYRNERRDVVVTEGQTATVSVDLVKHTLTVTEPAADAIWVMGDQVEIKWETGEESSTSMSSASYIGQTASFNREINAYKRQIFERRRSLPPSAAMNKGKRKSRSKDVESIDLSSFSRTQFTNKIRTHIAVDRPLVNDSLRSFGQNVRASGDMGVEVLTNVKIQLYRGDDIVETISNSTDNSGSYTWTVSTSLQEGEDYKIKISCLEEPGVADETAQFMITPGYQFITKWGSYGGADGQFGITIWGITISGYIYVADTENHRVQRFTSDGTFVGKWGSYGNANGQFYRPHGIEADSAGNIFVIDTENQRIQKFTSNGTFLASWGDVQGYADGQFFMPYDLVFDNSGQFYVADSNNHRIQKFTSDGTFLLKWGQMGTGDEQFHYPHGIAIDQSEYLYVVDSNNHRIQKFTTNGSFVTKWGREGTGDGEFNFPTKIDIDSSGYVYVVDSNNYRIQKFTSSGKFITKWGEQGSGDGKFDHPFGIAIDESGNIYVGDSWNNRIQKFGPNNK